MEPREQEFPIIPFGGQSNLSELWKKWRQRFEIRLKALGKTKESDDVKIAMLLDKIGSAGIDIYNTFVFAENEETYEKVVDLFEKYCTPIKNLTMEAFKFHSIKQKENQPFDQFVTELRTQLSMCEFVCAGCNKSYEDRMLKDRLVLAVNVKTCQEKFLREPNLSLDKALEYGRVIEMSRKNCKLLEKTVLANEGDDATVNAISKFKGDQRDGKPFMCRRCGTTHKPRKCPAFRKTCNECGGKNHFSKFCFKRAYQSDRNAHELQVDSVVEQGEENFHMFELRAIGAVEGKWDCGWNRFKEDLWIREKWVTFKIDTGAEVSVIPLKFIQDDAEISSTKIKLVTYNQTVIYPIGISKIRVECKNGVSKLIEFVITKENFSPIISGVDAESLCLIKRINSLESYDDFVNKYKEQFTGLGCIPGEYSIKLKDNYVGHIQANRKSMT